jgi:hypothetical protein
MMKTKNLLERLATSSVSVKIATIATIVIWITIFVALFGGTIFMLTERPGEAQRPTPDGSIPVIVLEPTSGSVGTPVTVRGEGWNAGSMPAKQNPLFTLLPAQSLMQRADLRQGLSFRRSRAGKARGWRQSSPALRTVGRPLGRPSASWVRRPNPRKRRWCPISRPPRRPTRETRL